RNVLRLPRLARSTRVVFSGICETSVYTSQAIFAVIAAALVRQSDKNFRQDPFYLIAVRIPVFCKRLLLHKLAFFALLLQKLVFLPCLLCLCVRFVCSSCSHCLRCVLCSHRL